MRFPDPTKSQIRVPQVGGFEISGLRNFSRRILRLMLRLLALAVLVVPLNAVAQESTKRVLILTGSDPNRPGFVILTRSIQATLRDGSQTRVELLYELQQGLLDTSQSPTGDRELISYLKQKYASQRIDLILVIVASRFRVL